jgi:hypothetical protein
MNGSDWEIADRIGASAASGDGGTAAASVTSVHRAETPRNDATVPAGIRLDLRDLKSHLAERTPRRTSR